MTDVKQMSPSIAVKKFLELDSEQGPITTAEFMAFWKDCSQEDRKDFALTAATELGVVLKPV